MPEHVNSLPRSLELKPRSTGTRSPEELEMILRRIYPEGTVAELMEKLFGERKDND